MKKTIVCTLVFALLLACLIPFGASAEGEPQPISTAAEFEAMSATGSYYLTQDIDFGGKQYETYIFESFSGTLDGRGHTIYHFSIASTAESARVEGGIFRYLAVDGNTTICNLQIGRPGENISFSFRDSGWAYGGLSAAQNSNLYLLTLDRVTMYADVSVSNGNNINVGGFLGASQNCLITDCTLYGSVCAKTTKSWVNVAGFSANPKKVTGSFESCRNFADITVFDAPTCRAGGLLGYTAFSVSVRDCMNAGSVSVATYDGAKEIGFARLGGIVAESFYAGSVFEGCFNYGTVSSPIHAGGIIGYNCRESTVRNCVNYGLLTAKDESIPAGAIYGATERDMIASGNKDMTGMLSGEVSEAVTSVGVQNTAITDGIFDVRFLATVDALSYSAVGFEVEVFWYSEGTLVSKTLLLRSSHVYEEIYAEGADGSDRTVSAAELGGNWIAAISVFRVPADAESGNVTFVCRPFAVSEGATLRGGASVYTYRAGEFVSAAPVS